MFPAIDFASIKNVGRVGALAVALGIGGAVSFTPCVARADDSPSTASESPAANSTSGANVPTDRSQRGDGGQRTSRARTAAPASSESRTGNRRGPRNDAPPAAGVAAAGLGEARSSHRDISGPLLELGPAKTAAAAPEPIPFAQPKVSAAVSVPLPAVSVATQTALPAAAATDRRTSRSRADLQGDRHPTQPLIAHRRRPLVQCVSQAGRQQACPTRHSAART